MNMQSKTMAELVAALDVTTGNLLREVQCDIEQALTLSTTENDLAALTIGCSMRIKQVGVDQYGYDVSLTFTKEKKKSSRYGYVGCDGVPGEGVP